MHRREFLALLALVLEGDTMANVLKGNRPLTPALFVGHGSPMNAIADNAYTRSLTALGKRLGKPEAILVVSAHWQPPYMGVSVHEDDWLMYDFSGFPDALYEVEYPAPAAPGLVAPVTDALGPLKVAERPLDHGAWSVLRHLYPDATVPVMQLGLNANLSPAEHVETARRLAALREHGIMIIGSGNVTHNLYRLDRQPDAPVAEWAKAFDADVKTALLERDIYALTNLRETHPFGKMAHPTSEHYLPLLYAAAMRREGEPLAFPYEGFEHGSISMRTVLIGDKSSS